MQRVKTRQLGSSGRYHDDAFHRSEITVLSATKGGVPVLERTMAHSDRGDYFHGRMRNDVVSTASTTSLIRYDGKES